MVSTTSVGMVTPGIYEAGSGTTRVIATDWIRENRTASVLVSALGASLSSDAGCSSVWLQISLLGVSTSTVIDRKSTRLNSSHSQISYAVFCLKKKKN